MPVQVIINAVSPEDAMGQMAAFLGLKRLDQQVQEPQAPLGNGAGTAGSEIGEATGKPATPKRRGRPAKEEVAAETAAQDDADERQEDAEAEVGVDDVRAAMNEYVRRFGMEAANTDVAEVFKRIFTDGSVQKLTAIPEGMHSVVVAGVRELIAKNPFHRKALAK